MKVLITEMFFSLSRFLNNIWFLICISWIILDELSLYYIFKNYDKCINNLTTRLSNQNILCIKMFQAIALNNNIIDEKCHDRLLKFTDEVPWTNNDIDLQTLVSLEKEYNIKILNNYKPINSGMISLVFKATKNITITDQVSTESVIIKMKRNNIENNLDDGIEKMLFCIKLLSFIPIINNYQISNIIHNNINLIKLQTDFNKEVENIKTMKNNCKKLKYIKIPLVYEEVTNKFSNTIMMEYIKGEKLQNIDPSDYNEYSKQVIKFVLVTLLMNGICHGDLHVGNILFIKDNNDPKYKHKIGILDFGIIYDIDKMKETFYYIFSNMCNIPSEKIAHNVLMSGLFEPVECIKKLPQHHYNNILAIITKLVDDTINVSKHLSHVNIFKSIFNLNDYIVDNNLMVNGLSIRPSTDMIKSQMIFAMLYGVIFKLCGDKYIELINKTMHSLFYIEVSES
jgi:predicted unusual protein kinase regulating ubiquinone biosynthesis (AarF/ABC1/UbiB family)